MRRLEVLLTNDDGPESPLLVPFAEALAAEPWCAGLRVLVPVREKSWIGKAITKFSPLTLSEHRFGLCSGHLVSVAEGSGGTPADCVELGLGNLYPGAIDLVVSGINMGLNTGTAFALSSGTVGGALEATLNGIPSIALSAEIAKGAFTAWAQRALGEPPLYSDDWARLARSGAEMCRLLVEGGLTSRSEVLSVNFPWNVSPKTPVRLTRLKRTRFRGMFQASEIHPHAFVHRFPGYLTDEEQEAAVSGPESELPPDIDVVAKTEVSVTAFGPSFSSRAERTLVEALERAALRATSHDPHLEEP